MILQRSDYIPEGITVTTDKITYQQEAEAVAHKLILILGLSCGKKGKGKKDLLTKYLWQRDCDMNDLGDQVIIGRELDYLIPVPS